MDNRAIGVFDSGLGGLTAVKQIRECMPNEDIIYFGDTGRVPYGTRSRETIIKYAKEDIAFLSKFDIKTILVACGTVSTIALESIESDYDFSIYGIVQSSVKKALSLTKNKKIGVLGTNATVASELFVQKLKAADPDIDVIQNACPLFVSIVENGFFHKDNEIAKAVVKEYLNKVKAFEADTLILGCTHFPLLREAILDYMGDVNLVDSGYEAALRLKNELDENNMRACDKTGKEVYYISDNISGFSKKAMIFLEKDISDKVKKVDIQERIL